MNAIRFILTAIACAWERWSDKQQDIYDDHQANAEHRHYVALKKEGLPC